MLITLKVREIIYVPLNIKRKEAGQIKNMTEKRRVAINFILSEHLNSLDQICHFPYCQPYNSYNVSSENLVLDQLIIPKLKFFLYSHHLSS